MAKYYIFDEVSPNIKAPFLDLPPEIDLIESLKGKRPDFDALPIEIEAAVDNDVVYTDIINPGVPLFSQRVKEALENNGVDNVDYYPIAIVDEDTREVLAEYWLAVIKEVIACMDLEKSQIEENKKGHAVVTRFKIDSVKTKGIKLFRFHNIPALILIDEHLKNALDKLGFVGVRFMDTDTYCRQL